LVLHHSTFAHAASPASFRLQPDSWFAAGGHNFRQVYDPASKVRSAFHVLSSPVAAPEALQR
jgi:hypothetical protein